MAFATIDMTKGITGVTPTANLPTIPVTKGGTNLTSGTTDQFLKFTGTTTIASAADNAGALVPVKQSSGTSATANVIVNGWITDTYENYVMDYYFNVATSGEAVSMTLYDASGNISSGSNYDWSHLGIDGSDGSTETLYNSGQNAFRLCHGANNDAARFSVTGRMVWLHPRLSGKRTTIIHNMRMLNASAECWTFNGAFEFKGTNQLTGFYCNSTSGDIDNWGVRCYGIQDS